MRMVTRNEVFAITSAGAEHRGRKTGQATIVLTRDRPPCEKVRVARAVVVLYISARWKIFSARLIDWQQSDA
jgi:hypothetical protein